MTRLEAILNNTTDGIVLVSLNHGIEQSNSTFNMLFVCEPGDYFGHSLHTLVNQKTVIDWQRSFRT